MSKLFKTVAAALGATAFATLTLGVASEASQAAKPINKTYCERVCTDGACFNSCSEVMAKRKIKTPPTSQPRPEPQPVPNLADWRENILHPSGGSGGAGGGGGNR